MTFENLVKISLFLNLYLSKEHPGTHIETQCLEVGEALWIANNDDADTALIRDILIGAGVSTPTELLALVDLWAPLVAETRKCKVPSKPKPVDGAKFVVPKDLKCKVFMEMCAFQSEAVYQAPAITPPAKKGVIHAFNIETSGNAVPMQGVVCISGNFAGDNTNHPCHAEMKLLKALHSMQTSLLLKKVTVGGCKPACNVCADALKTAASSFGHGMFEYQGDAKLASIRSDMTPRTAAKARALPLEWALPRVDANAQGAALDQAK